MIPDDLKTKRLSLRPFVKSDAAKVYAYWKSDPGWERYNASIPENFTEADAADFVEEMRFRDRSKQPNWAILHNSDVVGVVSLSADDPQSMLLGYGIHAELRGGGLVVEDVQTVLAEAFAAYPGLDCIKARIDSRNVASMRVLAKLGFAPVGEADDEFSLERASWNKLKLNSADV